MNHFSNDGQSQSQSVQGSLRLPYIDINARRKRLRNMIPEFGRQISKSQSLSLADSDQALDSPPKTGTKNQGRQISDKVVEIQNAQE